MRLLSAILVILITTFCSCNSSYSVVNSETYDDAGLESHKTFHIVDLKMGALPPHMDRLTYENIVSAIRGEMLERGYKESPGSPLLVNFAVTVHDETVLSPSGHEYNDGPYYSGTYPCYIYPQDHYWDDYFLDAGVIDGIYEEGVLTIDIINIKKKETLYTSSVASIMDSYGNYRDVTEIGKAVTKLFSDYPVRPLSQYSR